MKYGGGGIMVWGCFAVLGSGQIDIIDRKIYSRKAIYPPVEAQQKTGDATGQQPKSQK